MNITVYLGANEGKDPQLKTAVRELGSWIGSEGHRLIYGGSKCGLMGELAESVLLAGGEVVGVEPQFFLDAGLVHDGITQTIATETMAERKVIMMDLADAYIALPGGSGTLDEISEVIVLAALGKHGKPCILYNKAGFYEPLMALYCKMRDAGFMTDEAVNLIRMASTPEELENIL
jgi:uncharacterized protein (TIGR00730 family)